MKTRLKSRAHTGRFEALEPRRVLAATYLTGDFSPDGQVDVADISAAMTALSDLPAYQAAQSFNRAQMLAVCDSNHDGNVDNLDVQSAILLAANTRNPTWFDTHTNDPGIQAVGDQELQDGTLNRLDMIGLLREVEAEEPVTAGQMADLTAVVNAPLFGNLDYVQQLAQNIVLGNVANAHYQGAALGNLAVGSSAAQLELLVDKWFLGTDHPAAGSGYSTASGPLFLNGAAYTDIAQGGLGDCGLVSTFAEVALRRPDIVTNMFIVNGDSTDTVRFYQGTAAHYVTVDSQLPGGYASIANELWVGLAEKAYAQINEEGWLDSASNGQNAYGAIVGTYIHDAQAQITGLSTVNFGSVSTSFSTFATLVAAGKMIGFASVSSPPVGGVIGNHAYAVISCDSTAQTVTLYNPGGSLVTLTWPQIQADFMYFERTA